MNSIIDRISRNAKHIKEAADANSSVGPFTRALLNTDLGDLIRDIHPSELGLFTLQNKQEEEPQIVRVQFHGATPLRKKPIRRDEGHKSKEYHPETYAQAALSYIERFESIRRMPRAHSQVMAILDRLNLVQENIKTLQQTLQQVQVADGPSLKSQTDSEEARIDDLKAQIAKLNERKARIAEQTETTEELETSSLPLTPMKGLVDDGEWNFPDAPARTLHFTDSLLINESVDLGDASMTSMLVTPTSGRTFREGESSPDQVEDDTITHSEDLPTPAFEIPAVHSNPSPKSSQISVVSAPKMKINTEVECIAAKIWASIGDLIKPGHGHDLSGDNKPPRAKETIEYLQSVAALSPVPQSPTYSSSNTSQLTASPSAPSAQQILIAQLLISLLSSPRFAMPLNDLKTVLAQKSGSEPNLMGVLGGPQGSTKVLYVCVAKRLVAIDRSGGKQIVKFDL